MLTYVIILIVVLVIGIPAIFFVNKEPKLRIPLQVFFGVIIVVLAVLLINNINKPINFEKELKVRSNATIDRLKDIRTIQLAYKDKYSRYMGSFDTLIHFVKTDSFEIADISEVIPGSWKQDDMTKEEALKEGVLVKTATYVAILDSLWKDKKYDIENIRYIPYTNKVQFTMGAGEIETASKVKVKVFECYALYSDLLFDLDKQLVVNYIDEKTKYGGFAGIKVGSLEETTNNAGNWEK
jgi:hypothetical protein